MVYKLTPKQKCFVDEYLVDLNATQAAIRAGYSPKRADAIGYDNLRKAEVAEAITKRMAERSKRTEVTQDYVLSTIVDTVERCRQVIPVLDKEGNPTGEYRFDAASVLKGCDLLGKHLGMFKEKVELTGKGIIDKIEVVFVRPNFPARVDAQITTEDDSENPVIPNGGYPILVC